MRAVAQVLIVEDSRDIADLIRLYLERAGHVVSVLDNGSEVMRHVRAHHPEVVVLDLMLPGMDGLLVCQALRREPSTATVPILMLTARGEEADRIRGLEVGADDYVTKPFSPKELVARVAALLRRVARPAAAGGGSLQYGPISMDLERHHVTVSGRQVVLTAKEFLLLKYLLEHRGRVLSRDVLLSDVWGYQYTGGTRTVDVHVRRLREKVPYLHRAIATIKQFGYRLEEPAPPGG
jgi:DNA-binding response OmpR family regulator